MDTNIKLISGGVYKTILSNEPVRVLAFDAIEVFYDAYWSTLNKWTFASSLKRRGTYYRTSPNIFLKDATFLTEQHLTEDEFKVFRPDLPFRLCRNKKITWTDKMFQTLEGYKNHSTQFNVDASDRIVLPVSSITLEPFGAKGRVTSLKSTLVTSGNSNGFTAVELLWLANNIQAQHAKHVVDRGVGIYRSGHEKKIPSYYIGGYYDLADNIPKEE